MAAMSDLLFKICFVSPTVYPLFNAQERACYGEAEIQIYELASFFGKEPGMEISVATGDYGQDDMEFYSGVLVYKYKPAVRSGWRRRLLPGRSSLHELLKKIDASIYIMAGASGLAGETADFCAKNRRGFLFRVAHQRDCDGTFAHGAGEEGEKYLQALRQAYCVICQTQEQQTLLRRRETVKTIVIPNGVAPRPLPEGTRNEVVWFGETVNWKQPELFFRLALSVPEQRFTFCATPDDPEYFERLVAKTRDIPNLGVQNSMPYHEVIALLDKAKLLVNTSRFEGFPYLFSQAFAAGVPVVSLNADPDGVIEKNQLGVYAHGSEVRMVQGVRDLIAYEKQWQRLSDNAVRFANEEQNIHAIAGEYDKLFLKCAGALGGIKKKAARR